MSAERRAFANSICCVVVYTILTAQLVATAIVSGISFWSDDYKNWIQSHPALVWVSVSKLLIPVGNSPSRHLILEEHLLCGIGNIADT
jgi:hypothetical protein